jgi:hypothetical protein
MNGTVPARNAAALALPGASATAPAAAMALGSNTVVTMPFVVRFTPTSMAIDLRCLAGIPANAAELRKTLDMLLGVPLRRLHGRLRRQGRARQLAEFDRRVAARLSRVS